MPCPLLIFSQPDYLIQVVDTNLHSNDNQCRSRSVGSQLIWIYTVWNGISGFSRAIVKIFALLQNRRQNVLILSARQTETDTFTNSADPDETARMSRLISIYTVCHSVFDVTCIMKHLIASVDMSKFKYGRVHCRKGWQWRSRCPSTVDSVAGSFQESRIHLWTWNRQTCQKEKCMINRLWYSNFHQPETPISAQGPKALGLIWVSQVDLGYDMKISK